MDDMKECSSLQEVYVHISKIHVFYLAYSSVSMYSSSTDETESSSRMISSVKKAGCLGGGNAPSLINIKTTDNMVGLSSA